MKKINTVKQLQAQKKELRQQQLMLEGEIKDKWEELKECLNPSHIAKDTLSKLIQNKAEKTMKDDGVIKTALTYGITLLANQFVNKAGEKLSKVFKK